MASGWARAWDWRHRRHGIRVRTLVWLGLTTPKWRRSSVAIVVRPSRSATVITAGVDAAEVLVGVVLGQLGDARPVGSGEGFDDELAVGDRPIQRGFGGGPELAVQ